MTFSRLNRETPKAKHAWRSLVRAMLSNKHVPHVWTDNDGIRRIARMKLACTYENLPRQHSGTRYMHTEGPFVATAPVVEVYSYTTSSVRHSLHLLHAVPNLEYTIVTFETSNRHSPALQA